MSKTGKQFARKIAGADLFCGSGGFSSGFMRACKRLGLESDFVAVNHWDIAIATHSSNHPNVRHILDEMQNVKPSKLFRRNSIEILLASPECIGHSRAAGGVPKNPQSRATAGYVIRWARALSPKVIIVENVREFLDWGPLSKAGKPLKRQRGVLFHKWVKMLKRLGYNVEWRVLCAADYGDPTTRERLFIIARSDGQKISWPEPTHSKTGATDLFGDRPKWKSARDHVIDWNIQGQSIFNRKIPLKPNTMRRIWAGMRKFGGAPFLSMLYGTNDARDIDRPAPTILTGNHTGLTEPFIIQAGMSKGFGQHARSVNGPVGTVVPTAHDALVQPFLLKINGGKDEYARVSSVEDSVSTVTGHPSIALVEPELRPVEQGSFILPPEGIHRGNAPRSEKDPLQTVTQRGGGHLVSFMLSQQSGGAPRATGEPAPTVAASGAIGLVTAEDKSFLMAMKHPGTAEGDKHKTYGVDDAVPTLTTHPDLALIKPTLKPLKPFVVGAGGAEYHGVPTGLDKPLKGVLPQDGRGLVQPYLVQYNGQSDAVSADMPVPTIPTHDRFALAEPFLTVYHGKTSENGDRVRSTKEPLGTVDTSNRYGLVIPHQDGWLLLDIFFRMLTPRELARAQGFADEYQFSGTLEQQKKQIGNAVPVGVAEALCLSQLESLMRRCPSCANHLHAPASPMCKNTDGHYDPQKQTSAKQKPPRVSGRFSLFSVTTPDGVKHWRRSEFRTYTFAYIEQLNDKWHVARWSMSEPAILQFWRETRGNGNAGEIVKVLCERERVIKKVSQA